jgi:hypothetical protein
MSTQHEPELPFEFVADDSADEFEQAHLPDRCGRPVAGTKNG